jgi:hypothetical protein
MPLFLLTFMSTPLNYSAHLPCFAFSNVGYWTSRNYRTYNHLTFLSVPFNYILLNTPRPLPSHTPRFSYRKHVGRKISWARGGMQGGLTYRYYVQYYSRSSGSLLLYQVIRYRHSQVYRELTYCYYVQYYSWSSGSLLL